MKTRYDIGLYKHYSSAAMSEAQEFMDKCESEVEEIMERLLDSQLAYTLVRNEIRLLVARVKGLTEAIESKGKDGEI